MAGSLLEFPATDRRLVLLAIGPRDHESIRFDARFQLGAYDHLRRIVAPEITAGTRSVDDAAQRNLDRVARLLAGGRQFDRCPVLVAVAVDASDLDGGNVLRVFS